MRVNDALGNQKIFNTVVMVNVFIPYTLPELLFISFLFFKNSSRRKKGVRLNLLDRALCISFFLFCLVICVKERSVKEQDFMAAMV